MRNTDSHTGHPDTGAPSTRTNRWKRRIIFLVLLLAAAGGLGAYLWIRSTPEYALRQIRTALVERDARTFHTFVDANAVIAAAAAAYEPPADSKNQQAEKPAGLLAKFKRRLAQTVGRFTSPMIISDAEDDLDAFWAGGITAPVPAANEPLEILFARHLPDVGRSLTLLQAEEAPQQTIVRAYFNLAAYDDARVDVRLRFRKERGKLRLVEIVNFAQVAKEIRAAEVRWKAARNAVVEAEIRNTLRLVTLSVGKDSSLLGFEKKLIVRPVVKGLAKLPFLSFQGVLEFKKRGGNAFAFPVDALVGATGAGMQGQAEIFLSEENGAEIPAELWEASPGQFVPSLSITSVTFVDGKRLQLPYPEVIH